jgi:hypothetical protein
MPKARQLFRRTDIMRGIRAVIDSGLSVSMVRIRENSNIPFTQWIQTLSSLAQARVAVVPPSTILALSLKDCALKKSLRTQSGPTSIEWRDRRCGRLRACPASVANNVRFRGKADMTFCGANVH